MHTPDERHKGQNWSNNAESSDFMTLHSGSNPDSRKAGYELADANVKDTAIFLVALAAVLCVVFVVAFGIGKLLYYEIGQTDGAPNKWSIMAGAKKENLASNPVIEQQQLKHVIARFPEPRLQTDDGNMDLASMHAREDMMLEHYTWVNQQQQTVRIPIERAMQLLAQRGLPVQTQTQSPAAPAKGADAVAAAEAKPEQPMFGDASTTVTAPLTDGFAPTATDLKVMEAHQQELARGAMPTDQESIRSTR
jgi:hypothetical protein